MRLVGLTGGIASGKSTISKLFKANGIPVVDADVVSRDVVRKGTGGWRRVVKEFGQEILQDDGEIDRAKLGQIIFSDPAKRQVLNRYELLRYLLGRVDLIRSSTLLRKLSSHCRLLAPFISTGIFWEVFKLWMKGCKVIVLDIPLLFEAKMDRWTKPIVVVWIDPEKQLERLMARDGSSEEQARNRVDSQMALDWKRTKADIVIDNSGSLEETKEQFQKALAQIMGPLSWTEFMLSRSGAFSVLVSVIVAVVACRSML